MTEDGERAVLSQRGDSIIYVRRGPFLFARCSSGRVQEPSNSVMFMDYDEYKEQIVKAIGLGACPKTRA